MGKIGVYIRIASKVVMGGASSLYILVTMPVIIAKKIYGKIKYGKSLYD